MPSRPDVLFGILFFDPQRHITQDDLQRVAKLIGAPTADLEIDRNFGVGIQRHVVASDAQSPGLSRSSDLCVALTGEIENRAELVAELARRGTRPATDLDADLVAALWRSDGEAAAAATHGYFNAVVWDRERRELVLLVDRCAGVKSLSYHRSADRLVFGSTIKAVLAHPHVPRELDPSALEDLLVLRHPVSPRTMLASVSTLEAGTSLAVRGDAITLRRYWRRRPWRPGAADVATLERDYLAALERAVARRAGTDEAHVMLSGGVDSAVLVALLRRLGTRRVRTYSVHIGDAESAERAAAREIARLFATEHRPLDGLGASCLDALPEMIWHHEAAAVETHPTYHLARVLRDECDVVLGGYGNDILWGVARPRWMTGAWARRLWPPLNELHHLAVRRKLGRRALRALLRGAPRSDVGVLRRLAPNRVATGDGASDAVALDEALFADQVIARELGKVLVDAHGVWPRLPYTDAAVVRVAEAVPPASRLRVRGREVELKAFFKDVVEKSALLPPAAIRRPKTWMRSPTAAWLRADLRDVVRALLLGARLRDRRLFDHERIVRLLDEHQSGRFDHAYVLMMLVAIEVWHRLFIDRTSLDRPDFGLADCALGDLP